MIVGMLSLETIGYCSDEKGSQWLSFFDLLYARQGNFIALVTNPSSRGFLKEAAQSFRQHARIGCETAILPTHFPGARSSDQWSFLKEGYPALMVTDTAPLRYPFYHKPQDTPDKVRCGFLYSVVTGLKGVISGSCPPELGRPLKNPRPGHAGWHCFERLKLHVASRLISPDFGIQTFDLPIPTRKILLFSPS